MWLAIMELSVTKMVDPSTLKDLIASCKRYLKINSEFDGVCHLQLPPNLVYFI